MCHQVHLLFLCSNCPTSLMPLPADSCSVLIIPLVSEHFLAQYKMSQAHFIFSYPGPDISHFFKGHWFLLMIFRNQALNSQGAHSYWSFIAFRPFGLQKEYYTFIFIFTLIFPIQIEHYRVFS